MDLNPQQFEQPMLGTMREDYPLMPEGGTTFGDELQPLYRAMDMGEPLEGSDRDIVAGALSRLQGGRVGAHWTHDLAQAQDWASGWGDQGAVFEAEHPGRDNIMDWENPDDIGVMADTIVAPKYRNLATPEVPVRPGSEIRLRGVHVETDVSPASSPVSDAVSRRIGFFDRRRA